MLLLYPELVKAFEANKELFTRNKLPFPAQNIYLGQPADPEKFEFTLPAVFFQHRIDWRNNQITVIAHVLHDFGDDTESFSPRMVSGLDYLRFLAICRHIITGVKSRFTRKLQLTDEEPVTSDYYYYHTLSYTAEIENGIDGTVIPYPTTDIPITGLLDRHDIKEKIPAANKAQGLDMELFK